MDKTITIVIQEGTVREVDNLPEGWDYEVIDHDVFDELKADEQEDFLQFKR